MTRPLTLFTGQWADLPFEEVCRLASSWGYDGLEIACSGDHLDADRGAVDDAYIAEPAGDPRPLRPAGVCHLGAPPGSSGLRRPDRPTTSRHPGPVRLG